MIDIEKAKKPFDPLGDEGDVLRDAMKRALVAIDKAWDDAEEYKKMHPGSVSIEKEQAIIDSAENAATLCKLRLELEGECDEKLRPISEEEERARAQRWRHRQGWSTLNVKFPWPSES
jgi:hypothetical protein